MRRFMLLISLFALALPGLLFAQANDTNDTNDTDAAVFVTTGVDEIGSPWAENSKICIFVREWILKGAFLFILLVFIAGVATFSGAAFPEWRNYGTKMVLGPIAAVILYVLGTAALRFFMGTTICGLGVV